MAQVAKDRALAPLSCAGLAKSAEVAGGVGVSGGTREGRPVVSSVCDTGAPRVLSIAGTRLRLDGEDFAFQGLSFFNAVFNGDFNRSAERRTAWLRTFRGTGVTCLRVWCQWDFASPHLFADVAAGRSLFDDHGGLVVPYAERLDALARAARELDMALEVTVLSQERRPNLSPSSQLRAVRSVVELLRPYRNVILQLWNESSIGFAELFECAKATDPERLVTSSPGVSNVLGSAEQNLALDLLTPHTVRQPPAIFWRDAPGQIALLLAEYGKPVIDDEPARCGLVEHGGIIGGTTPEQHITHFQRVVAAGGYYTYHHDMFQGGYGDPATPPSGVPDPAFSPFHARVFAALAENVRRGCQLAVAPSITGSDQRGVEKPDSSRSQT